jgi:hypothetical protein
MPTKSPDKPLRKVFHVTPRDDTYAHVLDANGTCWCCPELDEDYTDDPDDKVFVHNAYDCREEYEFGLRKPH